MKWRSIVLPVWKKPAAKGPWYQVESKPVMPVPRRSFTPLTKWPIAMPAISRATTVAIRDGRARPRVLPSPGGASAGDAPPGPGTNPSRTKPRRPPPRAGTGRA